MTPNIGNDNADRTQTLYCAEGGVHLYSSEPFVLTPADLYLARENPALRQLLEASNLYLITARPRILIDPDSCVVKSGHVFGQFIVRRSTGIFRVSFTWSLPAPHEAIATTQVEVLQDGTHLRLHGDGGPLLVPTHVIVAHAQSELRTTDRDLEVLYVGQAIGRTQRRSALDRLLSHTTLQRILAEMTTFYPLSEIILLLYRFEHRRTIISTGGDLTTEPSASSLEEMAHLRRMSDASLSRHDEVALAEVALIRYFQPWFNVQIKNTDFSGQKKIKVLDRLLQKDLSGLIVEISSAIASSRLKTVVALPHDLEDIFAPDVLDGSNLKNDKDRARWKQELHTMAHTHFAKFPLTTPAQRDTFMHGVRWHGHDERAPFMG